MIQRTLLALVFVFGGTARAQVLDLPARASSAQGGTALARAVVALPQDERERKIRVEVEAGNVPDFLRRLVPVSVSHGADKATYFVTPDYLAVGSDSDFFLTPLTPQTAQAIADRLACTLPTPRMVDEIYANASVKLPPTPIPPSPAMTTVPVFLQHNATVAAQRGGKPPGGLVAGHKKDIVIANKVFASPGKVAIYGWHTREGAPIQPLYTGHTASWVDYSHGIRLVQRRMTVNGVPKTIDEVLADPQLAPLLSHEGPMRQSRYAAETGSSAEPPKSADKQREEFHFEPGVRVVIDHPENEFAKPALLVLYGLPNGNTVEQTMGKPLAAGDDWHFDIQHIAAQTRFLRRAIPDRVIVVAYLENALKSWPAWRKAHGDARIPALLDEVRSRVHGPSVRIVLAGHSGGGSMIFGYLNSVSSIPDDVERIAFLDANYAYDTDKHADKLARWLQASASHWLVVLAYDDAAALLNGKSFVSAEGGTWGRSRVMRTDLEKGFPLTKSMRPGLERWTGLDGRITLWLKDNPERKVWHTIQVERNGFIECLLAGTPLEEKNYTYFGDRAYTPLIRAE